MYIHCLVIVREADGLIDTRDLPPLGYKVGREHDDHHEHEKADEGRQPQTAQHERVALFLCGSTRAITVVGLTS